MPDAGNLSCGNRDVCPDRRLFPLPNPSREAPDGGSDDARLCYRSRSGSARSRTRRLSPASYCELGGAAALGGQSMDRDWAVDALTPLNQPPPFGDRNLFCEDLALRAAVAGARVDATAERLEAAGGGGLARVHLAGGQAAAF